MTQQWIATLTLLTVAVLVVTCGPTDTEARDFEITPMAGYQFGGKIGITDADLDMRNSPNFGLFLGVEMKEGALLEFSITREDTQLDLVDSTGTTELFDVSVEYYHVGGVLGLRKGNSLTFTSVSAGLTHLNAKGVNYSSDYRFSFAFGVGGKWYFTDHIGLRVHGRLLATFIPSGADIFCTDGQCLTSIETSAMLQGEISAGLIILFSL